MIQIRETGGDTLVGAIDGVNVYYTTTYTFNLDSVNVYVNGRLKIREWDDGFYVRSPNVVVMKEPLLEGDSLEVEYKADIKTGGGADGGVPVRIEIEEKIPDVNAIQNLPGIRADDLGSSLSSDGDIKSEIGAFNYRPVILKP